MIALFVPCKGKIKFKVKINNWCKVLLWINDFVTLSY